MFVEWHARAMLEADTVEIVCPRCGSTAQERFYGPCAACRDDLRSTMGTDGRVVEVEAYEPKMNVTPNQIATKD